MTSKPWVWAICAMLASLSQAAAAQPAHSTTWINLRAGPSSDYPLVARLAPGTPLAVQGCTAGFGWCDVIAAGEVRGWAWGGAIATPYQSAQVPIIGYGAVIGIPIVTFVIGSYWGSYYRDRPWYGRSAQWDYRPPLRPGWRPAYGPPPRAIVRPPGVRPPSRAHAQHRQHPHPR